NAGKVAASNSPQSVTKQDLDYLRVLAQDTYRCIARFTEPRTFLPLDNTQYTEDVNTSVTNIGFYVASVAAAVDLGFESREEAVNKLKRVFLSLSKLRKWKN